ncbi:hypothetical protein XENOCAPTIV_026667 [Xenoophorus captivus]|uniref:Uncharacterized protein n=1 Tax=Xenoophorus captivus TaxID=1517983 RepID=A0ABV0QBU8_9TELE
MENAIGQKEDEIRDLSNNQISEIAPDAFQGLRSLNSLPQRAEIHARVVKVLTFLFLPIIHYFLFSIRFSLLVHCFLVTKLRLPSFSFHLLDFPHLVCTIVFMQCTVLSGTMHH